MNDINNVNMLSIVVSVYNERDVLNLFYRELETHLKQLNVDHEIIFVNDGSTDDSQDVLSGLAKVNKNVMIIRFSKNFGHEAAMSAGIDYSSGDAVVCMDADLQHPPAMLGEMLRKCNEGYDIINMVRNNRDGRVHKTLPSRLFYHVLNMMSPVKFEHNASDFFLISRRVADILRRDFCERTRFLRGLIQIVGFKKTTLEFDAPKRQAGKSKYSIVSLFTNAITAIATFSNLPLRVGVLSGSVFGLFSIIVGIYSIIMKLLGYVIPGYTTIVVLISLLFAIQFFVMGIIAEYLGFLFNESKKRPIYIVQDELNVRNRKK